jgi:putative salt-induced outer membrane protein YdiY
MISRQAPISFLTRLLCLSLLLTPMLVARPKVDVLVMKNGDRITCEIRKLEQGQLQIKTSYTIGTIPVDWTEVERIESKQYFRLEMSRGERHTGTIEMIPKPEEEMRELRITEAGVETEVPQRAVVVIDQLERTFWSNLSGSVDAGFGFTRNNSTASLDLNAALNYKSERRYVNNSFSTTVKRQTSGADTNRNNFTSVFKNQLRGRYFANTFVDFLQSDEQKLDLRTTLGGGLGRYLILSNRTEFLILGGAVYTRENFTDSVELSEAQSNAEGMAGATFSFFRFDSSEFRITTLAFPSFTVSGRVRVNSDATLKLDLWGDLYFNISMWENYDSKPPLNTSKIDYGISSTVGWKFP